MSKIKKCLLRIFLLIFIGYGADGQTTKILFDASKAETSGNADWVIDANTHNLGFTNGPAVVGQGTESNAQRVPSPSQSFVDSLTSESYWNGALSYWGIDCVANGYQVETLPYNGSITFGDSTNLQDLSNYKVFIICEPNIVFTTSEKSAILNFVQNGGGLFMISDHDVSDRNGDGWDSPHIWNDFLDINPIQSDPFGISFDYDDISQTSTNIASLPGDSILHGRAGNVTEVKWSDGTTMTLRPSQNPTVKGVIYKSGSSIGNTNVMCAYANYGSGKVAAIGDSSPCDDGTGDTFDNLYDGYIADASGNHRKLLMNITIWLASNDLQTGIDLPYLTKNDLSIFPNPIVNGVLSFRYTQENNSTSVIQLINSTGKIVKSFSRKTTSTGMHNESFDISDLAQGVYILSYNTITSTINKQFVILN